MLTRSVVVIIGLLMCIPAVAWAQVDPPKGFEGVVPLYPGAVLQVAMEMAEGSQAIMETEDKAKAIVAYYKEAMVERGWNVEMEMTHGGGAVIAFTKDDRKVQVVVDEPQGEMTKLMIMLTK
jgi:hypothetical protein